jgi:hypothetical protein
VIGEAVIGDRDPGLQPGAPQPGLDERGNRPARNANERASDPLDDVARTHRLPEDTRPG